MSGALTKPECVRSFARVCGFFLTCRHAKRAIGQKVIGRHAHIFFRREGSRERTVPQQISAWIRCVYVLCLRVSVCVSNVCVGIAAEPCIWSLCPLFGSGTPLLYQVGISGAFSHAAARHLPLRGSQHPASHRNRCSSCLILSSSLARRQDWQLVLLRCHGRRAMLFGSRLHLRHRYDFECPPVGAS